MRIAFLGNFTIKKGSRVFAQAIAEPKVQARQHKFYILGYMADKIAFNEIRTLVKSVHLYEDESLAPLLTKLKIDVVVVASIWPETYSRTFFKAVALGYPVIAPKAGNPYAVLGDKYPLFYADTDELINLLASLSADKLSAAKQLLKGLL